MTKKNNTRRISYREYRRRVFNTALLECFCRIHGQILNGNTEDSSYSSERLSTMASNLCRNFYNTDLQLDESTVAQTRERLKGADYFIQECGEVCEQIADQKAQDAEDDEMDIQDDQKVELSDEDQAAIDQVFEVKGPTPQIDQIRDATVAALMKEEEKAQEIRDAMDIAKSQVASGEDNNAFDETVRRIEAIGPTSLMNSIINRLSTIAINEMNESGTFRSINDTLSAHSDGIKDRACMIYALYEMANTFGIHKYNRNDISRLAAEIFYGK